MELLDLIIPGIAAAIAALSETLKGLIGKYFPKVIIKNQLITLVGAAIVLGAYYFLQKPDLKELLNVALITILASGGVYGFLIKPIKKAA